MENEQKPREKLAIHGSLKLETWELLAILLGTGTAGKDVLSLAKEIADNYSLERLTSVNFNELLQIKGISVSKSSTILAALEFGRRVYNFRQPTLPTITTPQEAAIMFHQISLQTKEHFQAAYLNTRNQLIHLETITIGILDQSLVHPREVFEPAIKYLAKSIILAHNHPSGDLKPSKEDIDVTKRLIEAGKILGIEIIDHLIVSKEGFESLKEEGFI